MFYFKMGLLAQKKVQFSSENSSQSMAKRPRYKVGFWDYSPCIRRLQNGSKVPCMTPVAFDGSMSRIFIEFHIE